MKTMSAVQAKTHFGKFLDTAQREPVLVTKKDRPVAVMFSIEDLQDTIWGEKARLAHKEGYLSVQESEARIAQLLNVED